MCHINHLHDSPCLCTQQGDAVDVLSLQAIIERPWEDGTPLSFLDLLKTEAISPVSRNHQTLQSFPSLKLSLSLFSLVELRCVPIFTSHDLKDDLNNSRTYTFSEPWKRIWFYQQGKNEVIITGGDPIPWQSLQRQQCVSADISYLLLGDSRPAGKTYWAGVQIPGHCPLAGSTLTDCTSLWVQASRHFAM